MYELTLDHGVPVLVTPSKTTVTIQNDMKTSDDKLYVSMQNDVDAKWISVGSGDSVKFGEPMYVMQKSWAQWVFPVIEHD